jgi:hypothetical protein
LLLASGHIHGGEDLNQLAVASPHYSVLIAQGCDLRLNADMSGTFTLGLSLHRQS